MTKRQDLETKENVARTTASFYVLGRNWPMRGYLWWASLIAPDLRGWCNLISAEFNIYYFSIKFLAVNKV